MDRQAWAEALKREAAAGHAEEVRELEGEEFRLQIFLQSYCTNALLLLKRSCCVVNLIAKKFSDETLFL